MARLVKDRSPLADTLLDISGPFPVCRAPAEFEAALATAKADELAANRARLVRDSSSVEEAQAVRLEQQIASVDAIASMWKPRAPYMVISSLRIERTNPDGSCEEHTATTPVEMCAAVREAWALIFTDSGANMKLVSELLAKTF